MMAAANPEKDLQKKRQAELLNWFEEILPALGDKPEGKVAIRPLSEDASFRRYFFSRPGSRTYVLVDAPPEKEDSRTFVQVARSFLSAGINVPEIFEVDYASGFMCISYLGDSLLWEKLDALKTEGKFSEVKQVYEHCFEILLKIQGIREGSDILLPPYDSVMLMREMELFRDWFCSGVMGLSLSDRDNDLLSHYFEVLMDAAMAQTQVCVHRDYHSRNLMYQPEGNYGVLDFQDAVIGPVTYDLVSLIKDCYINWPRTMIREWALQYANMAQTHGILESFGEDEFLFDFDMMGVQRHLKAVGIFSRLCLRDGKPGFLADIPRTLAYIKEVLSEHPEMEGLGLWLEKNIYPMLVTRLNTILKRYHLP